MWRHFLICCWKPLKAVNIRLRTVIKYKNEINAEKNQKKLKKSKKGVDIYNLR